ncbi:MAG: divalent-cation tolerance protein CutA [Candidatus Zapsychrus exili]|nr:divalent-cation tolerance protein CutA [Candidatus Zapsychrus exili]
MYIVVFVTTKDRKEAKKISDLLIEKKLVACVNIVDKISSIFWWEGKVSKEDEALLIMKTKEDCFQEIVEEVKAQHSYDVPEIIAIPIINGNKDYLDWINDSIRK